MKVLPNGGVIGEVDPGRRNVVPVVYVTGSHYEVGYDVGRTFSSMIQDFVKTYQRLGDFEKQYQTETGRQAYDKTLMNMKTRYPHYVKELQGIAEGSGVPFHKIFLLHLDDIIDTINEENSTRIDTGGCSSIGINAPNSSVLGHTEDAFAETLNHFYIVSAHIIPTLEDQKYGAVEERFASVCYAGQLPGYTSGYNHRGMVFSINTLSPLHLKPGATPRTFVTRAMLAAKNVDEVERILQDEGLGVANGFSLNLLWSNARGHRQLFNIEVAPDKKSPRSLVMKQKFEPNGESLVHCNKYLRLKIEEVNGPIIDSSNSRLESISQHAPPRSRDDVADILSDVSGKAFKVFQDEKDTVIKTINAGIFDLQEKTWSVYIGRPNSSEPVAVLPIRFTMLD